MGSENRNTQTMNCLRETGRFETSTIDAGEATAPSARLDGGRVMDSSEERRVISRFNASLIVAVPGLVLLGVGILLLHTAPVPGQIIGQERVIQRFCGLVATTTGTAALAASVLLVTSTVVRSRGKQSRLAVYVLGLAVLAALVALT